MQLLDINELLEFAVQLEEKGETFYLEWAEKSKDEGIKKLFKFLAEEESIHIETFKTLQETIGQSPAKVKPSGDYEEFFKTFVGDIVFNAAEVKQIKDLSTALEFAKKQELDSLLFYTELRNFVSVEHEEAIINIIEEERRHFVSLSNLKDKLLSADTGT
jgi:rubrerythrin